MNLAWILNTASLFAMATGSLLFFLGLWKKPRPSDGEEAPDQKHLRFIALFGGLMSLWFVIQYLIEIVKK